MTSTIVDDHTSNLADFGTSEELWDDDVAHEEVIGDDVGSHFIEVGSADVDQSFVEDVEEGIDESVAYENTVLQMKNGRPVFTLNLPDLLAHPKTLTSGETFYICFSKKCARQLAYSGYIYNMADIEDGYNFWRCANPGCTGSIRSGPNFESIEIQAEHLPDCVADDKQVRLRVCIYDLRLMAEFTDIDLLALYNAYVEKVRTEQADIGHLFPSFETIKERLERHRNQLIFRRNFEIRKLQTMRRKPYVCPPNRPDPSIQFRRTKAFPPSICVECNLEIHSNEIAPSHDLLIDHLDYQHQRQLQVERYTFPEAALFEQWIRELQQHSRYRLRKLGLYDEHMYYLCHSDDRQQRCNHGKGSVINLHCSAFVRVHDWRYILRREIKPVVVDYCLDHMFHSEDSPLLEMCRQPLYVYYSPDVFIKDLEARRQRTQLLLKSNSSLQRVKRVIPQNMETSPINAVQAHPERTTRYVYKSSNEITAGPSVDTDGGEQWLMDTVEDASKINSTLTDGCCSVTSPSKISRKMTLEEKSVFDIVHRIDIQCEILKQRMQHCRRSEVARKYLSRISSVLDDIMADPFCSPRGTASMDMINPGTPKLSETGLDSDKNKHALKLTPISVTKAKHSLTTNPDNNIRQAMFLRRGENGEMVIVRRTMKKFRKLVHVPDEQVPVSTSYSNTYETTIQKTEDSPDIKNIPDDLVQADDSIVETLHMNHAHLKDMEPSSNDEIINVHDMKPAIDVAEDLEEKNGTEVSPPKRSRGRPRKVYSPS
ncbi:unnamed protein product [Auanema sp. JU1783]|nr:unnamed protein product [Auanema sp. JU1783]